MRCVGCKRTYSRTDRQLQCHHLAVGLVRKRSVKCRGFGKGASCYYASARTNESHVAINVAHLAERIRDVASYTSRFRRVRVYSSSMCREVSGAFRAAYSKPGRMKSLAVVLAKTFDRRVILRHYSRRFHPRLYLHCHHPQVPSLSLSRAFDSFSDFSRAKTNARIAE